MSVYACMHAFELISIYVSDREREGGGGGRGSWSMHQLACLNAFLPDNVLTLTPSAPAD